MFSRFLSLSLLGHMLVLWGIERARPSFVTTPKNTRWIDLVASQRGKRGVAATASTQNTEGDGLARPTNGQGGPQVIALRELMDLGNKPPEYPSRALAMGWEGEVLLQLVLGSKGVVEDVKVSRSSGFELLDSAAVTAAKNWKWPGGKDTAVLVPIVYELKD